MGAYAAIYLIVKYKCEICTTRSSCCLVSHRLKDGCGSVAAGCNLWDYQVQWEIQRSCRRLIPNLTPVGEEGEEGEAGDCAVREWRFGDLQIFGRFGTEDAVSFPNQWKHKIQYGSQQLKRSTTDCARRSAVRSYASAPKLKKRNIYNSTNHTSAAPGVCLQDWSHVGLSL